MTLYDDYTCNYDENDIKEFGYFDTMYANAQYDLAHNFQQSPQYIVQATSKTHYPDFYPDNRIGYKLLDNLDDIWDLCIDCANYTILEHDKTLKLTKIGHDNNYYITIKALNKHYNPNTCNYDKLNKLFTKYSKNIKEIK